MNFLWIRNISLEEILIKVYNIGYFYNLRKEEKHACNSSPFIKALEEFTAKSCSNHVVYVEISFGG